MVLALILVSFDVLCLILAGRWLTRSARCPHCAQAPDAAGKTQLLWTLCASCRRCAASYWLWQALGAHGD